MNSPKTWREILQVGWQTLGGMRTMSMAWLRLSAFIVLLLGCFHTAVTENDVTPRLTFSYSKFHNFFTTEKQPLYKLLFFFFKVGVLGPKLHCYPIYAHHTQQACRHTRLSSSLGEPRKCQVWICLRLQLERRLIFLCKPQHVANCQ